MLLIPRPKEERTANRKKYIRAIKNRKIEYGNEISYTAIPYPIQKVADSTREDKQKGRIKTSVPPLYTNHQRQNTNGHENQHREWEGNPPGALCVAYHEVGPESGNDLFGNLINHHESHKKKK